MTDLPTAVTFATVTGWFTQAVADSNDSGREPDMLPMDGSIVFIPNVIRAKVTTAAPQPMTLFPRAIECSLDDQGFLVGPDGSRDVVVVATGTLIPSYTVTFTLTGIPRFTLNVVLPAGATVDLTTALEVPTNPGSEIAAWIVASQRAVDAADAAASSAAEISDLDLVLTVNGQSPDGAGNIVVASGGGAVSSVAGRAGVVVLARGDVGLGNVDNTTDLGKPLSTATATALGARVPSTRQVNGHALDADVTVSKNDVGLGNVDNTTDLGKPVSTATATALGARVPSTRKVNGHALDADVTVSKTDVGLDAVDNTSDVAKPVSAAAATAIAGKLAAAVFMNGLTGVWIGTQAQYDAIVTKTSTVLYAVTT